MTKLQKKIFLFGSLCLFICVMFATLNNADEVAFYNFARNIAHGNLIYKDFNYICFPLYPWITGLFLKVFGEELIVLRIFSFIVLELLMYFTIKFMQKLKIDNFANILLIMIYILICSIYESAGYNLFVLMLVMLLMNIEFKQNKTNLTYFLMGCIIGFSILTKHTIGLILLFVYLIIRIFEKNENKVKNIVLSLIPISIMTIGTFIYLKITNSVSEFIDYTFLGMKDFTRNTFTIIDCLIYETYFVSLCLIVLIALFIFVIYKIIKTKDLLMIKLFLYSLVVLSFIYPIASNHHIFNGFYIVFIIGLYFLNNKNGSEKLKTSLNVLLNVAIIFMIIISILMIVNVSKICNFKHFKYIQIVDEQKEEINTIIQFSKDHPNIEFVGDINKVYSIIIDRYDGILDSAAVGNLGSRGEQALIDEIEDLNDCYFLFIRLQRKDKLDQTPIIAKKWVDDNCEFLGYLGRYRVYYKK